MGILQSCAEDIDFQVGSSTIYVRTDSKFINADLSRCAISVYNRSTNPRFSNPFSGGGVTSCWLHFRYANDLYVCDADTPLVGLCNSTKGGTAGIWAGTSSSDGQKLAILKDDGTTRSQLAASTHKVINRSGHFGNNRNHIVDLQVSNYGASATVNLYLNGSLIATYSGDISISGFSDIDCIGLGGDNQSGNFYMKVSEVIAADEDTRRFSLMCHHPTGAGDTNQWTGAYTDIDETTLSTSDVIYTDTDDYIFQAAVRDTASGWTARVRGIKVVANAYASADATANMLRMGVKSAGSADIDSGQLLTTSWATYERWATTINGGSMILSLLDAMQLHLQSEVYTS